jgi:plastocyanin
MMSAQTLSVIGRTVFVVLIPGLFLAAKASATTYTVEVGQAAMRYTPSSISIAPGDTVEWNWHGTLPPYYTYHSVTAGTPANPTPTVFNSGVARAPFTFSHTFTTPGNYPYFCQIHTTMMTGSVTVVGATPTPTPSGPPGTFGNISTRLRVETDDNVLIGGFIITGTQPKNVIVRAIGPSLTLPEPLADPVLELHGPGAFSTIINDNWRSDQEAAIMATTIPPSNDLESSIVASLPANSSAYTAIVRGANNGTGIGVVEAYDLDSAADSKLANISTRGLVQTGNNVLIGGFIIVGQNPMRVMVRAIGPSLSVPGPLEDPTLELRNGDADLIAFNDNWRSDQEAEIIATTIQPSNDLESALVQILPPGNYTVIVHGVNNVTGVGLVEAYALD